EAATRTLREREEELAGLNAVAAAVGPSSDLERQIDMLLRKAIEVTRHAAGAVYLVEEQGGRDPVLRFARGIGEAAYPEQTPEHASRRGEGLAGRVWEGGRPAAVPDLSADPAFERGPALHRAGYKSLICVPLRARARTVGVLELLATEHRGYAEAEVNLARAIGDQIGLAIQTGRLCHPHQEPGERGQPDLPRGGDHRTAGPAGLGPDPAAPGLRARRRAAPRGAQPEPAARGDRVAPVQEHRSAHRPRRAVRHGASRRARRRRPDAPESPERGGQRARCPSGGRPHPAR